MLTRGGSHLHCFYIVLAHHKSRKSLQFRCYQMIEAHHYQLDVLWGLE